MFTPRGCTCLKCTNIKFSHRFHRFTQKFIAEKRLPQNTQIYTEVYC